MLESSDKDKPLAMMLPTSTVAHALPPSSTLGSGEHPPIPNGTNGHAPMSRINTVSEARNGDSKSKIAAGTAIESSDSDEEIPLARRAPIAAAPRPQNRITAKSSLDDAEELPLAPKPKAQPKLLPINRSAVQSESDSEDDVPLIQRRPSIAGHLVAKSQIKKKKDRSEKRAKTKEAKRKLPEEGNGVTTDRPRLKRAKSEPSSQNGTEVRWQTLEHNGVLFPPEYVPHGVKMLYDGVPLDLTPEQEEVATMFAVMKETDYMKKPTFLKNFWDGFKQVLGPNHTVKSLDKCDFTAIFDYHMAERERKKALTREEKEALKRQKDDAEAKYKSARIDDRIEQVGNFRVEPPGLFRGRGEHPKMGMIKKRIYPRDITINIGKGAPIPEHPYPDQTWKEVRHDNTVTWLAYWRDPINTREFKYVFLAANSAWKSESDLAKYEKARKLKDYIGGIRETYTRNWDAKDIRERQMATALYFIDILALRAGHEKDDDEADTVGCCTLKVENVECLPPNHIKFDFLGKDSIRYENTVEVDERVFKNIEMFMAKNLSGRPKKPDEQLFDGFDAQDLNVRLKDLMDGLSVKVFRTYNASITLDRLLQEESKEETVDGRKAEYDRANKEVAILCNHQRSVPKGHEGQLGKLQDKLDGFLKELKGLEKDLKLAKAGKPGKDGKTLNPESIKAKIERKKVQIAKAEISVQVKEDLKTVALGTSKLNYMDPRITVAWCKRNEVPIEKVFNKSLLSKFLWSMEIEPEFKF